MLKDAESAVSRKKTVRGFQFFHNFQTVYHKLCVTCVEMGLASRCGPVIAALLPSNIENR